MVDPKHAMLGMIQLTSRAGVAAGGGERHCENAVVATGAMLASGDEVVGGGAARDWKLNKRDVSE